MRHLLIWGLALVTALSTLLIPNAAPAAELVRFTHHGDGAISLASGRASFTGRFREANGNYNDAALRKINRIFGAPYGDPASEISIRFIEFLDFLQDHYNPRARITIASGYRSPTYNTSLRDRGKLAAKASLHQYGMAADLSIEGVAADDLWNFVKELKFGGAGYYHGKLTHVDVGPARSWDETTSGVGTNISEENKLIVLVADKDRYLPGEPVGLRFIRMTAFPIGVAPTFTLERETGADQWKNVATLIPRFRSPADGTCPEFDSIAAMAGIQTALTSETVPGNYRVRATFCNKAFEAMPVEIVTDTMEVMAR